MKTQNPPYKRILLKISGESLLGKHHFGVDPDACLAIAKALKEMHLAGLEVAVVIGGGNIFRGVRLKEFGMSRTPADQIGMLATLINGIALHEALVGMYCKARLMSALECPKIAESYNWGKAIEALSSGHIVLFVGGTGNPYFTTDTAAALRASEIEADIMLKATKVDGIYNKDPIKNPDAVKYDTITYSRILNEKLEIMDSTSVALCMNNQIPILVFNMNLLYNHNLPQVLSERQGTLVSGN